MAWLDRTRRRLRARQGHLPLLAPLVVGAAVGAATAGCYTSGNGTAPPPDTFYFPVGLAVSSGGNVLYVANSDFDLQWNGGTLQSYDLNKIRQDTVLSIQDPSNPSLPLANPAEPPGSCPGNPPHYMTNNSGQRQPLGQTCAPQIDSTSYVRDSAIIGAFATDLQLSDLGGTRLFFPVRGNTSLSWADVAKDDPTMAPIQPPANDQEACATSSQISPFTLCCGLRVDGRCGGDHQAGNRCTADTNAGGGTCEPGNTRFLNMPGEPFGMAQTADSTAIVVTNQTVTESSLFLSGLDPTGAPSSSTVNTPSFQFAVPGVENGGNGIALVPHDPYAFPVCPQSASVGCPRPAFLQTSRYTAKVDLLRYYADQDGLNSSGGTNASSLLRPFMVMETSYPITVNASGTDSRGIAIDPTPRLACEATVGPGPENAAQLTACARIPARVFIANRAPNSLLIAEVGAASADGDGTYDEDQLVFSGNIPLNPGPSRVYVAPIIDSDGNYAVRVFVVCFDSNSIYVYDPNAQRIEAIISVGVGPFALAFDPFSINDVALRRQVPPDPRAPLLNAQPGLGLKAYRFAYVASFTDSYVQLIDLDNSRADKSTFETVVYTLGTPTLPKGTQ